MSSNWGGSRKGAGRPSMGEIKRLFSDLPIDMFDFVIKSSSASKKSVSAWIRELIQAEREKQMSKAHPMSAVLESFLESPDFGEGCKSATISSWRNSGIHGEYSVELFHDGSWRVLWNNEIGNKYASPGVILDLPTLDDSDYQECVVNGEMTEDDFFYGVFQNDEEDLKQEMRDKLNS